jgi:hypothetical protein
VLRDAPAGVVQRRAKSPFLWRKTAIHAPWRSKKKGADRACHPIRAMRHASRLLAVAAIQAMLHQITANRAAAQRIGAADITAVAASNDIARHPRSLQRRRSRHSGRRRRGKSQFLDHDAVSSFLSVGMEGLAQRQQAILPATALLPISRRTQFRAARKSIPKSTVNNTNLKPIILLNQQYFFCTH